jgi:hypothetical protein
MAGAGAAGEPPTQLPGRDGDGVDKASAAARRAPPQADAVSAMPDWYARTPTTMMISDMT